MEEHFINGMREKRRKRRTKKSGATKFVGLSSEDEEILKCPTDVRKDVKNLLLKAIDEAAETLKQLPRAPIQHQHQQECKKKKSSKSKSKSLKQMPCLMHPQKQQQHQQPQQHYQKSNTCDICPLKSSTKKAFSESFYSRDQFSSSCGHHTVTREYFSANGIPIASPSSNYLANPKMLNTIVIQTSGGENDVDEIDGMILDFKIKLTKPDGSSRDVQLGIELPSFDD